MRNILLISEDRIKSQTAIPDNIWGKSLMPAIRESQDIFLQPIIGECLYGALLDKVEDGSISLPDNIAYKSLLDEYVQPYLMYQTISNLIPILSTKIGNLGTIISNDQYVQNLSETEREDVVGYYKYRSDFYCRRMQTHLINNKEAFPELDCCSCENIKANLKSAATTGIFLGGYRARKLR